MYTRRQLPLRMVLEFSSIPVVIAVGWAVVAVLGYEWAGLKWLAIPFVPVSLMGIAVSFYVGFKNNASNERLNQARKNWGTITNESRTFTNLVDAYVPDTCADEKRMLLRRHIAWLHAHAFFLRRRRMEWEHSAPANERYRRHYEGAFDLSKDLSEVLSRYLNATEAADVVAAPNAAARLITLQSQVFKRLRREAHLDDFRMFEFHERLTRLLDAQGANERLKTFPVPRQYANFAHRFVVAFSILLPFGLLKEMQSTSIWLVIPFSAFITWVFVQMELIGDYSENPFEGLAMDVPIHAIIRNIEIEMMHALGEKDLPPQVVPLNGILL